MGKIIKYKKIKTAMKSFFTAMIATYAVAEQVIKPGIEAGDKGEFLVNIMNNMSGNVNAQSFGPEREARATEAAAAAMQWMNANQNDLPRVCTKGQECRDAIQDATEKEIQDQWTNLLERIGNKFENALVRNIGTLEDAWKKAAECEHGCFCPTAWIKYTEHIQKQIQINKDVDTLIDELKDLYDKEDKIIETCPAYEYFELQDGTMVWKLIPAAE